MMASLARYSRPRTTGARQRRFRRSLHCELLEQRVLLTAVEPTSSSLIYFESLDTDPGWSRQGEWAFGQPTGQGGTLHGSPDPSSGYTGDNVFGVNLNGDYSTAEGGPYYLTSDSIDCSGSTGIVLEFRRWLSTDYPPFVSATVDVSNDGTTWTRIYSNPGGALADHSWRHELYDISAVADNHATVWVRWGYQVYDGAYAYSGWNIDDIALHAASGDAVPPAAGIMDVTPNPRNTAVADITIVFSEPVVGFDAGDLMLTRNGNLLNLGSAQLTSTDGQTYTLANLTSLTAAAGDYVLTLTAFGSDITDVVGNSMADDAATSWQNTATGDIRGTKWEDRDGDGMRGPEEPGIPGWTIYLDLNENGQLDDDEPQTTTDADGNYAFLDVPAGTYAVSEESRTGWTQTYPAHPLPITPDQYTVLLDHFDGATLGAAFGNPTYTEGQPGLGQSVFLEPGKYIRFNVPGWYTGTGAMHPNTQGTVELWIRPDVLGPILDLNWNSVSSEPPAGHIMYITHTANSEPDFRVWNWDVPNSPHNLAGPSPLPTGVWTHLAFSWSPLVSKLYVNGSLAAFIEANVYPDLISMNYAYLNFWGNRAFSGLIDDLHISSIQRSDAEIKQHAGSSSGSHILILPPGGVADGQDFGNQQLDTTSVVDVAEVAPDPRNTPVATVELDFSAPIDVDSFTFADLVLTRDGTAVVLNDAVTIALLTGSTYRIGGLASFTAIEGTYELTVVGSGISDSSGAPVAGSVSDTWVLDLTAPTAQGLSPPDDAAGVAVDGNLLIAFSEAIGKGSGNVVIRRSTDGSPVTSVAVSDPAVSISGATVTIDPGVTLAAGTSYYIEVPAGAFVDLAGNPFAGISGSTAWNFTTAGAANAPLIVVGDHLLAPDKPGQWIRLFVSGMAQVTGLNVRAQLGDGIGGLAEPVFSDVHFAGGIWDAYPYTATGGPVAGGEQFVQASVVFNSAGQSVAADGLIVRLQVDTTGFTDGTFPLRLAGTQIGEETSFVLQGGSELAATVVAGTISIAPATVAGRHIFYNNSYFDGKNADANTADDAAIAPDKAPLLPGGTATFANYTSYSLGINGVMMDIARSPAPESISAAQFEFRVGNSDDPSGWATAPAPSSVTVRPGAGEEGSDRVTILWPPGAIRNQWLQITVGADAVTGLAAPDVFYFGNAVGESGNSTTTTFVDGSDFAGARDNPRNFLHRAPIDFRFDFNRDSFVDGADMALARDNTTNFLTALKLISVPPATPLGSPIAAPTAPRAPAAEGEAADAAALVFAAVGRDAWDAMGTALGTPLEHELVAGLAQRTPRPVPVPATQARPQPAADRRSPLGPDESLRRLKQHRDLPGSLALNAFGLLENTLEDLAAAIR